jgi:hypothetical protein
MYRLNSEYFASPHPGLQGQADYWKNQRIATKGSRFDQSILLAGPQASLAPLIGRFEF